MYRLFMWINNGEQIIQFPHVPANFPLSQSVNQNETYSGLSQDYTMISKKRTRREYEWSSWWDNLDSRTMKAWYNPDDQSYNAIGIRNGWEFVETLKLWMWRGVPLRMFLYNESTRSIVINIAVTIEDFDVTIAKTGRYDYKIKVLEYNFVNIGNEDGDLNLITGTSSKVVQPVEDRTYEFDGILEDGQDWGYTQDGYVWDGFFMVPHNPGVTPSGSEMKSRYADGYIWTGGRWESFTSSERIMIDGKNYVFDQSQQAFLKEQEYVISHPEIISSTVRYSAEEGIVDDA